MLITVDTPDLDAIRRRLGYRTNEAVKRALNETADTAVARLGAEIANVYNIKSTEVKESLRVKYATEEDLAAEVKVVGKGRYKEPLYRFIKGRKKPWNPAGRKRKLSQRIDYTFMVKKANGPFVSKGFFVAQTDSGHLGVFQKERQAKGRCNPKYPDRVRNRTTTLGINEVMALSIAEMAAAEEVAEAYNSTINNRLHNRLNYFMHDALRRMASGG